MKEKLQHPSMIVKLWGIRGSMATSPTPQCWTNDFKKHFLQFFTQGYSLLREVDIFLGQQKITHIGGYGVATTCVEVQTPKGQLIIDAGSGIKSLGDKMMAGPCGKGQGRVHIYFSQFHWDHIIGLPFFTPIFIPGNEIHLYSVQKNLEEVIKMIFKKPYFPVQFEDLPTKIFFHILKARETFIFENMEITPYALDHTDPTWGLRVKSEGKIYSHCSDTKASRYTREQMGQDLPLYQNADLMYFDSQFNLAQATEFKTMGSAVAPKIGIDIAMRENVKRIVFAHHDLDSTTSNIQKLELETQNYYIWKLENAHNKNLTVHPLQWSFAYEEQIFNL
jgi:phosphoribosyl 1,2-cyclic phosphodiesterase